MRSSDKIKIAILCVFTTTFYTNCSSFEAVNGLSSVDVSSIGNAPPPFVMGVDPHPEQYPALMGAPVPAKPTTLTPVTSWPVKDTELPIVPSNFDTSKWLSDDGGDNKTLWNGYDDVGAFRFICKPSHNGYNDPIVYPGQPGASHLHTFFGNTLTDANSTYQSLRTTGDGTCAGGPLNRSAYWAPALRIDDGDGNDLNDKVIMPDFASVYYKMTPEFAALFARGLRIIFGYNMSNPDAPNASFSWGCIDKNGSWRGGSNSSFSNIKDLADTNICQAGDSIAVGINAPNCWNGKLDSADHRSHIVQADSSLGYVACPATHPYHFPAFRISIMWTIGAAGNDEVKKMYLSSDHMSGMSMTPGSTMHTDWFGAWDDNIATEWMMHADADYRSCSGGDMCDGRVLSDPFQKTGLNGYTGLMNPANPRVVDPPVHP